MTSTSSTILLNVLAWLGRGKLKLAVGMGSVQDTEHAQHSTNVVYVGKTLIVTLFEKCVR